MFVATYMKISKSAEQFGKNPTALVNTPTNLQGLQKKVIRACSDSKFNKIPESSVKRKLALNICSQLGQHQQHIFFKAFKESMYFGL